MVPLCLIPSIGVIHWTLGAAAAGFAVLKGWNDAYNYKNPTYQAINSGYRVENKQPNWVNQVRNVAINLFDGIASGVTAYIAPPFIPFIKIFWLIGGCLHQDRTLVFCVNEYKAATSISNLFKWIKPEQASYLYTSKILPCYYPVLAEGYEFKPNGDHELCYNEAIQKLAHTHSLAYTSFGQKSAKEIIYDADKGVKLIFIKKDAEWIFAYEPMTASENFAHFGQKNNLSAKMNDLLKDIPDEIKYVSISGLKSACQEAREAVNDAVAEPKTLLNDKSVDYFEYHCPDSIKSQHGWLNNINTSALKSFDYRSLAFWEDKPRTQKSSDDQDKGTVNSHDQGTRPVNNKINSIEIYVQRPTVSFQKFLSDLGSFLPVQIINVWMRFSKASAHEASMPKGQAGSSSSGEGILEYILPILITAGLTLLQQLHNVALLAAAIVELLMIPLNLMIYAGFLYYIKSRGADIFYDVDPKDNKIKSHIPTWTYDVSSSYGKYKISGVSNDGAFGLGSPPLVLSSGDDEDSVQSFSQQTFVHNRPPFS